MTKSYQTMRLLSFLPVAVAGVGVVMNVPPLNSVAPITGHITDTEGMNYQNYKVAVLTSADNGQTWWDKSHSPYFNAWQANPGAHPNPGEEQNAAVVIQADWTWSLANYASSQYDAVSPLWRAYLMPATFNMRWPDYLIEGIPMRGDVPNNALAWVEVDRTSGTATDGGDTSDGKPIPPPADDNATPNPNPPTNTTASPSASRLPQVGSATSTPGLAASSANTMTTSAAAALVAATIGYFMAF